MSAAVETSIARIDAERARRVGEKLATENTAPSWKVSLRKRGSHFIGDEANVLTALREAPELTGMVRYNEFKMLVEFARGPMWRAAPIGSPWSEHDDIDLQTWLQKDVEIDVRQRGIVSDCIERVARDNPYHPVREYLSALNWDGEQRIDGVLRTHFKAAGDDSYLRAVGSKFLISAIARIFNPGCQVDHVLVPEGAQGIGKTSAVRILGGAWVADGLPNLHEKDASIYLQGVWIVELPELAAMRRSDLESTKAFLSRTTDRFRPPYGRRTVDVARQCVFVATTNESQYLRDPTGNRRFWPVSCGAIDLPALARDRDQLWAEAAARYTAGEPWHLTHAESALAHREQGARVYVSELEQQVTEYLDVLIERGTTETSIRDLLIYCLGMSPDGERFAESAGRLGPQVASILNRHEWQRLGATGRSPNRRVMYRHQPKTHRGS